MKYLYTFGLGAVAPWVAAVVLQRLSDFLSRHPTPTR